MDNLHELPSGVSINPPSLWFWVKAGAGFAIGFAVVLPLIYVMAFVTGLGFVGALLGGLARHRI